MAGDLRRQWVHTLTDHLTFSFPAKVFVTGNKEGAVNGFEIQGQLGERSCNIPVLAVSCAQGGVVSVSPRNTKAWMPPLVPRR